MPSWTLVEGRLADGLAMRLYIAEQDGQICHATLHDDRHPVAEDEFLWRIRGLGKRPQSDRRPSGVLAAAARQAREYFAGRLFRFDLPLDFRGTPFQVSVWQELARIPFAATRTYGEVAEMIGHPSAFRAVGNANGRNKLPVFVPCHRVLAAGGKLGGFTGGIGLKQRLLQHEAKWMPRASAA
jgi:methylated-DNA-[protein]-cysteine S-methyltransferase